MKNYIFIIIPLVVLTIGCSKEKKEWVEAKTLDSIPIYETFMKNFPNGFYADSAKKKIESRQIAIYSIPDSLDIYFGLPDLLIKDGWVKIHGLLENNAFLKTDYKRGVTPLKINDIDSGQYLIGIMPVEVWDTELNVQCIDPFLRCIQLVSLFAEDESNQEGGLVYLIGKENNKLSNIIILAKENISLDEYDKYYPAENNFIFNSVKLKQELHNKNGLLSDEELQKAVELLQRGGKIILNKGDIRSSIEIIDSLNWNIKTEAKILTNKPI